MSDAAADGIRVRGLSKHYGSTVALNGLDLDIRPGEILGIAGPNGAGKSTLVRLLAGEEKPTAGEMTRDGRPWIPTADRNAVAVVHQEPQLFPNLTVAQNMLVGREGASALKPRIGEADLRVMETLGIAHLKDKELADCSLATQQRTEIARAIARSARIFLFDEPNSALTDQESNELFREMRRLADSGRIVILVTHRLSDLVENARRVAVIRDGVVRAMLEGESLTEDGIARQLVVGGAADTGGASARHTAQRDNREEILSVSGWSHGTAFHGIDFSVRRGEIVALIGVEGSGARELLRSLAGIERCTGQIAIAGMDGEHALRRQRSYVPATRQHSLYSNYSVGENLLVRLGYPEIAGRLLALKKRQMRLRATEAVARFFVKTRTISQSIRSLSGGNQQKVAIAQALNCNPALLLLEEPSRGVDIHSRGEIYRLLRSYANDGNAVIMFCTEVLEVFEAADRVHVVAGGRLSEPLLVSNYKQVEQLATDITLMERDAGDAVVAHAA